MVMLESVESLRLRHGTLLYALEWLFTIIFTIEYAIRLYVARSAFRYARSFFGIVDLLSILPTYLDLLLPGAHYLMTLRVLRVLRIFRVLKMVQFVGEANQLARGDSGIRSQDRCFRFRGSNVGLHPWIDDVFDRRSGKWIHEYTQERILGDRNADDGRLRRYFSSNDPRPAIRIDYHDYWIRDYCRSNGNCYRGNHTRNTSF